MRLVHDDRPDGPVKLRIETLDDLWFLSQMIAPGDRIRARTVRRDDKDTGKERPEKIEKRPVTLTIEVIKVEFADFREWLRVLGKIVEGTDMSQHHQMRFEVNDELKVSKDVWDATTEQFLKEARARSKQVSVVFVALDADDATIALQHHYGLKTLAEVSSGRSGKQYKTKSKDEYLDEILGILDTIRNPEGILLIGPGFEKDRLAQKLRAERPDWNLSTVAAGHSGTRGIYEVLAGGEGGRILEQSRLAEEVQAVEALMAGIAKDEPVTYGPDHTWDALQLAAVETLLITDEYAREEPRYVAKARESGAAPLILSTKGEAGLRLQSLGGVGAMLRYRLE